MANFDNELKARAISCLENPAEVTDAAVSIAVSETNEIIKDRKVPLWARNDFALVRLKIYLKIGITEQDEILLKNAVKAIQTAQSGDCGTSFKLGAV